MNKEHKKILVVDDDLGILEALQAMLQEEGYVVIVADNGSYVENLSAPDLPDLILLDILLSGKDGRIITSKLKNQVNTCHIPIILLSAHPNLQRDAQSCGADDFVAKPFDIDVLLTKIEQHLVI